MSEDKKNNTDLDYIVWQYLQKETPSLATEFRKLKKIKTSGGPKVTLNNIYDIYTKNKLGTIKRQNESNKLSVDKKAYVCQDEENEKDNIPDPNEMETDTSSIKDQNNKENDKAIIDEELCSTQEQKNSGTTRSADNKKSLLNENNLSSKDDKSSGAKSAARDKSGSNRKKRKALLPKPKKKKTLLADPFALVHQNDLSFYYRDNVRKPLLPEPSPLISSLGPSGRKTLLAEPIYNLGRNERKPLLSDMPMSYSEEERVRKPLLTEPLFVQDERTKKPLLSEPVQLMQEKTGRIDRMGLLVESPPLTNLYTEGNERMALLSNPSVSEQSDVLYRRERKSLLNEPPTSLMLQDYLKRKEKESLLMDPSSSDHYFGIADRKVGLLDGMPLSLGIEDNMRRKKRALLSDRSPPTSQREYADLLSPPDSSDRYSYSRKETNSLPKPLVFTDTQEYDDSSHLYSRRIRTKDPVSDSSQWKDKGILLTELENYLKKHLSHSPERSSNATEKTSLLAKPIDVQDYEIDKYDRISSPSRMSPNTYAYYIREQNALLARKEYYRVLPKSLGFENARADKSGTDLIITKEKVNCSEKEMVPISMQDYEEELKSIGINFANAEVVNAFRRASENEFHSLDQDMQHRSYERFSEKLEILN